MTHLYKKETFAIFTTLVLTAFMLLVNQAYAESTVKNKININGVEYINEEVKAEGSIETDIDVRVKNNQGSIKYNVNGEEKTIQITPSSSITQAVENETSGNDEETNPTPKKEDDKTQDNNENEIDKGDEKENKKAGNLIEAMMQAMDNLFSRINDLFS